MLTRAFIPLTTAVQPWVFDEVGDDPSIPDCYTPIDAPNVMPAGSQYFGWNSSRTGMPIPMPSYVSREG